MPLDLAGATVALDLDGTLVDTAPDLIGALNVVLAEESLPAVPVAAARHLVGQGGRALLRRGFADAGREIDAAQADRLFARFLDVYRGRIADESRAFPGAEAALDALAAAGARLAVCTNKPGAYARLLLERLDLLARFAAVVGADETPARKPDPRHLLHTVRDAGGDPDLALMVGDSLPDVAAARGLGAPVVLMSFGYTDTPAAGLGADAVIDRFDQLAETVGRLLAPALSARTGSAIGRPPRGSDA